MKFVSLFAGVGGFDLGFERAGMECVGQVEIDKHANKVLEKNWKDVPKHDDVQTAYEWAESTGLAGSIDVVCGGFPCQDVSLAGKRAGLAGKRSGLFFDAVDFASKVGARWVVLENVTGLFSSNNGRDFATVINEIRNAGFRHIEWRMLDTQFFGIPQRRRRIFIVGYRGTPTRFPILVERKGSEWHPSTSATQRQETTNEIVASVNEQRIIGTLNATDFKGIRVQDLSEDKFIYEPVGYKKGFNYQYLEGVGTLRATESDIVGGDTLVVYAKKHRATSKTDYESWSAETKANTLTATDIGDVRATTIVADEYVRRLTPIECERLQGFPDNWTDCVSESQRYKQMGNAVSVPVAHYIGHLIMGAEKENQNG